MPTKSLVIVESPTKARTITKFLGKNYIIRASNGHIRDLPNSAAEIPAKLKSEPWAKLGVNIQADFEPLYVVPKEKKENLKALKDEVKKADFLLLATDEDREGESISWHLLEALQPKVPVSRLVFHEITKDAIEQALQHPREIDLNLVRAQETRRIVDRLFGYEISPLLWKKMAPRLSAGRVQSVAIRLLVERERERIKFRQAEYWDLQGTFVKAPGAGGELFQADLVQFGERKVAGGKDFDPQTGLLKEEQKVLALTGEQAQELSESLKSQTARVVSVEEKGFSSTPPPPFVTSTLQQEANAKLRFSAKHTMSVAQQLYENGFITYMRTDSTTLSEQALHAARSLIKESFGQEYLPDGPRHYATKVKNAQEAHEAIRPAGEAFTPPERIKEQLGMEAFRLYELIWKRTVASQMQNARGTYITVHLAVGDAKFRAAGKTIAFPGFLRAYVEGDENPEAGLAERERILPKLSEGEEVAIRELTPLQHFTQSPPRYTEGSLIRELEKRGIGRPSTWASIVELVLSRHYAFKKGSALVPTFTAIAVVGMLEAHFTRLLDYEFTARLEDWLDAISRGEVRNISYLKEFYYGDGHEGLHPLVESGESSIDPRQVCGIPLGQDEQGRAIEVRIGKYGPFLTNGEQRAGVPEGVSPDELTVAAAKQMLEDAAREPESLGLHPVTGEPIFLKTGPYGPYVQMGNGSQQEKPKMVSLLRNKKVEEVDLDYAVALLALPRVLGTDESGNEVIAATGRFGPYVKKDKDTRSIPADSSPLTITLEQALELLNQPKGGRARASAKPKMLRELGKHPVSEAPVQLMSGRYGPYVSDGQTNASLKRGADPEKLTLEEAVEMLESKAGQEPRKKPSRKRKAKK